MIRRRHRCLRGTSDNQGRSFHATPTEGGCCYVNGASWWGFFGDPGAFGPYCRRGRSAQRVDRRTNSLGVGYMYWVGMTSGCWCIGEGECPPLTDCDAIAAEWKMGGSAAFGCVWALVGIMYGARVFLPSMCKVGRRYHVTRMNELCELLLYVDDPFLTRPDV